MIIGGFGLVPCISIEKIDIYQAGLCNNHEKLVCKSKPLHHVSNLCFMFYLMVPNHILFGDRKFILG